MKKEKILNLLKLKELPKETKSKGRCISMVRRKNRKFDYVITKDGSIVFDDGSSMITEIVDYRKIPSELELLYDGEMSELTAFKLQRELDNPSMTEDEIKEVLTELKRNKMTRSELIEYCLKFKLTEKSPYKMKDVDLRVIVDLNKEYRR